MSEREREHSHQKLSLQGADMRQAGMRAGGRHMRSISRRHVAGFAGRCPQSRRGGTERLFSSGMQDSLGIYTEPHTMGRVIKPERIIVARHGESMGNFDESAYVHV